MSLTLKTIAFYEYITSSQTNNNILQYILY